jgi:hypothetical protein
LAVREIIETIEASRNFSEEASKKKEDLRGKFRKKKKKEKDPELDLEVETIENAYLQGSGPETWQGRAPTSSSLESLGSSRRAASSDAGPVKGVGVRVHQVQE